MDFNMDTVKEIIDNGVSQAQELVKNPSELDQLLKNLENTVKDIPAFGGVLSDILTMVAMVKGYITKEYTQVSPKVIFTIVSAFIYLLKKKDLINDGVPIVGMADDIAVITFALKFVEPELNAFKAWRDAC